MLSLLSKLQYLQSVRVCGVCSLCLWVVVDHPLVRQNLLHVSIEEWHNDRLAVCWHLLPRTIGEQDFPCTIAVYSLHLQGLEIETVVLDIGNISINQVGQSASNRPIRIIDTSVSDNKAITKRLPFHLDVLLPQTVHLSPQSCPPHPVHSGYIRSDSESI